MFHNRRVTLYPPNIAAEEKRKVENNGLLPRRRRLFLRRLPRIPWMMAMIWLMAFVMVEKASSDTM